MDELLPLVYDRFASIPWFNLQNCASFRVTLEVNAVKAAIVERVPAASR